MWLKLPRFVFKFCSQLGLPEKEKKNRFHVRYFANFKTTDKFLTFWYSVTIDF